MSGQGGVMKNKWDGIVPPECSPNPKILKFNAGLEWEEAKEPLHDGIDVTITNGIGPGMPFASSLLKKTNSSFCVVGLVPCAVTGTKIIEWQKGTNLYNELVIRAEAALLEGGGTIEALLWYQGESDTVRLTDANAYKARLQQFITDLRGDLKLPDLLVIQVALASGARYYLEIVREAQLNTDLPNVKCVDAKGLPLEPDNLHLSTPAQVILGDMLSDAFLSGLPS
ncbi:hypothetical protein ACH5RR_000759 [Cinchona calisaya]|uniref:Sialate O-acetylesterase domain-containing protein n=1 Tax=Cinchona calisaya TaxID=153742 RepID=A0ABD3B298_9GENT